MVIQSSDGRGAFPAGRVYAQIVLGFLRNKVFVVTLLITLALGYGFAVTHYSYGIDDTTIGRYFGGTDFLATGRYAPYVIHKLFGIYVFAPFWQDFLAVIMLFMAALVWCALIKRAAGPSVGDAAYVVFAAVFVSFPNINEIFIYSMSGFSIGLGFVLTGISLAACFEVFVSGANKKWLFLPIILMNLAISLYESFAPVYLFGMLMVVLLTILYQNGGKAAFSYCLALVAKFSLALACGIAVKYALSSLILLLFNITPSSYPAIQIKWGAGKGIFENLVKVLRQIGSTYLKHASQTVYTLIFSISCVAMAAAGIVLSVTRKNINILLAVMGMIVSTFLLTFIQGTLTPMRANQSHMLFVAFGVWLICAMARKWRRPLVLMAAAWLILIQTRDLSQWLYNDYLRYQQDKLAVTTIGMEVKKLDGDIPVAFTGRYSTYYSNLRHNQTNGISFMKWGGIAFGSDEELYKFFEVHGYRFERASTEQRKWAHSVAEDMPTWPREGSVKKDGGIIIVNLGNVN